MWWIIFIFIVTKYINGTIKMKNNIKLKKIKINIHCTATIVFLTSTDRKLIHNDGTRF